LIFLG
jgi:hypothetical protein